MVCAVCGNGGLDTSGAKAFTEKARLYRSVETLRHPKPTFFN
jgi:hypothetical protein